MKKILFGLLSFAALTAVSAGLSSCGGNSTDDAQNGITVESGDSLLTIKIVNDSPVITALQTPNGVSRFAATEESIPCALPAVWIGADGDRKSFEWKYSKTEKTEQSGEAGYIISFTDQGSGAEYALYVTAYTASAGPFEVYGYMKNTGTEALKIVPGEYFSAALSGKTVPEVWSFAKEGFTAEGVTAYSGMHIRGSGIYKNPLEAGEKVEIFTSTNQLQEYQGYIPMVYLDYGDCGMYFAQEWSSGRISAEGLSDGKARLSVQLNHKDEFVTNIPAGDVFYFPRVYLGVYDGDVDDGSNIFKRWFMKHKAPEILREDENEPLTQADLSCMTNIMPARFNGIQSLKWDYGFWSDELIQEAGNFTWRTNEGLLEPSPGFLEWLNKFNCAADLADFTAKLDNAGIKFALYSLLKDTMLDRAGVPTSVGASGHPEWFANFKTGSYYNSGDLGNEEYVKFLQEYYTDFFKENGITTWRSDFEPICHVSDKENRHMANGTDVQYWATIGFSELVDYLYDNIPGFRYESCSSGGSMKDLYTATKAVVINCDDTADYMSLHTSFYDSSYCIHPAQLQLPLSTLSYTKGSPYYTGTGDYLYGLRCGMTGAFHTGKWGGTFSDEELSYWAHNIKGIYNKKLKPLIREGDLYHILPRPDGENWDGLEYVDADTDREIKGVVMLWKPTNKEGETKTVKLRGLMADVSYQLTFEDRPEQNRVMTGAELMETGLTVTISGDVGSEMIWLTEAEGK